MKMIKTFIAVSLLCAAALPSLVKAQAYPARPIQFIVPYTPGTTADVLARLLGAKIAQRWGVPVVVDNKTGANMVHVPYKGTAGAVNDLIAGHVQASVVSRQSATPFIQAGSMRLLAVMGKERAPTFPQASIRSAVRRTSSTRCCNVKSSNGQRLLSVARSSPTERLND